MKTPISFKTLIDIFWFVMLLISVKRQTQNNNGNELQTLKTIK